MIDRIEYIEVTFDSVVTFYSKEFKVNKRGETVSTVFPPQVFYDPVKKMFIFKLYIEKEDKNLPVTNKK
jgi:hypothetical protein